MKSVSSGPAPLWWENNRTLFAVNSPLHIKDCDLDKTGSILLIISRLCLLKHLSSYLTFNLDSLQFAPTFILLAVASTVPRNRWHLSTVSPTRDLSLLCYHPPLNECLACGLLACPSSLSQGCCWACCSSPCPSGAVSGWSQLVPSHVSCLFFAILISVLWDVREPSRSVVTDFLFLYFLVCSISCHWRN